MTMVVENLNDLKVARHESAVYVKDANALLKLYRDALLLLTLIMRLKQVKFAKSTVLTLLTQIMAIMVCILFRRIILVKILAFNLNSLKY